MSEANATAAPAAKPIAGSQNPKLAQPATQAAMPDFKAFKHRVPVDGSEIEVDYDELRRGYSHAKAANQRFQRAAEIEKSAKERQSLADSMLKRFENPKDALGVLVEKFGKKEAKQYLEDFLVEEMEYEALPESERRARELEKKTKTLEEQLAEERREKQDAYKAQIEAKAHKDLDVEVGQALLKLGRNPTPRMVIAVVDEMILQGQMHKRRFSAEEALPHFQRNQEANALEWLSGLEPGEAMKKLPKAFLDAMRQHEVQQVLGDKQRRRSQPLAQAKAVEPDKKLGLDDWFKTKQAQLAKKSR